MNYILDNSQPPLKRPDRDRTVFIHDAGVSTTDFDLTDDDKQRLVESGAKWTQAFLNWFAAGKSLWLKPNPTENMENLENQINPSVTTDTTAPPPPSGGIFFASAPNVRPQNVSFLQNFYGTNDLTTIQRSLPASSSSSSSQSPAPTQITSRGLDGDSDVDSLKKKLSSTQLYLYIAAALVVVLIAVVALK